MRVARMQAGKKMYVIEAMNSPRWLRLPAELVHNILDEVRATVHSDLQTYW